jgi:hypothetical protein
VKIGVVGTRTFPNEQIIFSALNQCEYLLGPFQIVSGGAGGPDLWAEEWAMEQALVDPGSWSLPIIHEAKWRVNGVYNRTAGLERNTLIVRDSDAILAFWDGQSHGTYDTITKAKRMGKPVLILYPDGRTELQ